MKKVKSIAFTVKQSEIVREMWIFSLLNTVVVAVVLLWARVLTDMSVCLCEYVWGALLQCVDVNLIPDLW